MAPRPGGSAPAGHIRRAVGMQALARFLEPRGVDVARWRRSAGLDRLDLEDPELRLPGAVAREAWRLAAEAMADEAIAIHVVEARPADVADALDYAFRASASLREALGQVARYTRLHHDRIDLRLVPEGDGSRLTATVAETHVVNRYQAEFFCASLLRLARDTCDPVLVPVEVSFAHAAPASAAEHRRFFGCPVRFEQPVIGVLFADADLGRPMHGADPTLAALLGRQLDELVERLPLDESVSARARRVIEDDLASGNVSIDRVARQLAMSARTLARRLEAEGTSFRFLIDSVRKETAVRHLRNRRMDLMEVAFLLGYSESSAFARSFKRWTRRTPAEFRRQALA